MKQSAVGWIIDPLFELRNPTLNQIEIVKKAREMEKQEQDDFAIGFAEWCKQEFDVENTPFHNKWVSVNGNYFSTKHLLEIYKKEKGL